MKELRRAWGCQGEGQGFGFRWEELWRVRPRTLPHHAGAPDCAVLSQGMGRPGDARRETVVEQHQRISRRARMPT
eukprot:2795191-Rhodomonas_salina.3